MQVRDTSVVIYCEQMFSRRFANNRQGRYRMKQARKKQYSGAMTQGGKKRMTKAITLLCQASPSRTIYNEVTHQYQPNHRLSFITLTVANNKNLTAREGYDHLFRHFLQWLHRTKKVKMYVAKVEFQKRGQIHYHLTIPDFIHYKEIRDKWNELQRKAGLLDDYAAEHKHFNPNSTDIHDVRAVKNMANYLMKELGKTIDGKRLAMQKIVDSLVQAGEIAPEQAAATLDEYTGEEMKTEGKIWYCSDNLSSAKYYSVVMSSEHDAMIDILKSRGQVRIKSGDFWQIIYFSDASPPDLLNDQERNRMDEHLSAIVNPIDPLQDIQVTVIPEYTIAADEGKAGIYSWQQMQIDDF